MTNVIVIRQTANDIFVRRAGKVFVPKTTSGKPADPIYLISFVKNLESVGYAASQEMIDACAELDLSRLAAFNAEVMDAVRRARGGRGFFEPFYPNFPTQVMEMSEARLRFNALLHYLTGGLFRPGSSKKARPPLNEDASLKPLTIGASEEFEKLFTRLAASNTSISKQDKDDIAWFAEEYRDDVERLLPAAMPNREVKAFVCAKLIQNTKIGPEKIGSFVTTATDVLRLAVAMSDGDVSLAEATKFCQFKRPQRRLLLGLLEKQNNLDEDMHRWADRWIRLGERLHPGEYQKKYPKSFGAFDVLRNDRPITTFNSQVEKALLEKNHEQILSLLKQRPGEFARRLDHAMRITEQPESVLTAFASIVEKAATPLLLQVIQHFVNRKNPPTMRVFLPKGEVAKAQAIKNNLPPMTPELCDGAMEMCRDALKKRFAKLPALGKVYIDPQLRNFCVPFSQRSASKSLRTAARGSKLQLPDSDTIRFFLWWKNGRARTDIDLSAVMFDSDFCFISLVSYYNLKDYGGCHSGDIVDAPVGASEFIDVSRKLCLEKNVRYILMSVNSYTEQPFCDLPECFAGWMARSQPDSGEIYEPKTVQDKLDLSGKTKIAIPAIFDLQESQVIWTDMALAQWPYWYNNVAANLWGIQLTLKSMVELNKPNIYDLLMLHAEARGTIVDDEKSADTVFSVENETPFDLAKIASEFL